MIKCFYNGTNYKFHSQPIDLNNFQLAEFSISSMDHKGKTSAQWDPIAFTWIIPIILKKTPAVGLLKPIYNFFKDLLI